MGVQAHPVARGILQANGAQAFPCPRERSALPEPVESAEEHQVLQPGDAEVERAVTRRDESEQLPVRAVAELIGWGPSEPDGPCAWLDEAGKRTKERGLARPVGPEESMDLSFPDLQRDAVQRTRLAEVTHDISRLYREWALLLLDPARRSDEDVRHVPPGTRNPIGTPY
jgi:hypothetical protein